MENKTPEQYEQEIEVLQGKLTEKENELAQKIDQINGLIEINEGLSSEVEKAEKTKDTPVEAKKKIVLTDYSFENGGKTYYFRLPVLTLKKQKITPVEVVADKSLQDELIANNSAMIYTK